MHACVSSRAPSRLPYRTHFDLCLPGHTSTCGDNARVAGAALDDLGAIAHLDTILLSSKEGIEKPALEIFLRACSRLDVQPSEAVHVGDELLACVTSPIEIYDTDSSFLTSSVCSDYFGAKSSGLEALLVRRPGVLGADEQKEPGEDISEVLTVSGLAQVVDWVQRRNAAA